MPASPRFSWYHFSTNFICSFDFMLLGGILYLTSHLTKYWDTFKCHSPIRSWLLITYFDIFFARFLLFLFELSYKPMKFATLATVFCLAPWHLVWTILGTRWYREVIDQEFFCL